MVYKYIVLFVVDVIISVGEGFGDVLKVVGVNLKWLILLLMKFIDCRYFSQCKFYINKNAW